MTTKYAIVIPDGAADEPQESLGGKTPLQAARTPEMDRIAREGVLGPVAERPRPVPAGQRRRDAEPVRLRPGACTTPAGRRSRPPRWASRSGPTTGRSAAT